MDEQKLQEMQMLEQTLQNLLMQKQSFQMELSETESALEAINKSGDEVFKIIGQLMIKTEKSSMKEELENKKKMIELRLKTMENQEASMAEQLEKAREEIMKTAKNYLDHVYIGNISPGPELNTYCSKCGSLLIDRQASVTLTNKFNRGFCSCGKKLPGIWELS